jgi:hypothetical protein
MGTYGLEQVIEMWRVGTLTAEQAIGQILQLIREDRGRMDEIEKRLKEAEGRGVRGEGREVRGEGREATLTQER